MTQSHSPIAKEGVPFLILPLLVAVLAFAVGWWIVASLAIVVAGFIAFFFRNPKRNIPAQPDAILSPADGKIIHVGEYAEDRFLKQKTLKVSIFMSMLDVHINRAPVTGRVFDRKYNPGRFFVASREKSSLLNEQTALLLETEDLFKILVIQIAGFVARRIVCYVKPGDSVKRGDIFGLIRFGSRVDLYLPPEVKPLVRVGQHVKGGESIIGVRS